MAEFVVKVAINAAALWVAVQLVPQITFNYGNDWWKLVAVAVIVAVVNTYLRPIIKTLSFPISLLSLGLISFVMNAALLLLVAWVSGELKLGFRIDRFPPDITADAVVGALLGSIVISVVSTVLGMVDFGRRAVGLR
ncbi:MAG TPA: phage holin family protein [Candidatus Limnocylindrales bacterium]